MSNHFSSGKSDEYDDPGDGTREVDLPETPEERALRRRRAPIDLVANILANIAFVFWYAAQTAYMEGKQGDGFPFVMALAGIPMAVAGYFRTFYESGPYRLFRWVGVSSLYLLWLIVYGQSNAPRTGSSLHILWWIYAVCTSWLFIRVWGRFGDLLHEFAGF